MNKQARQRMQHKAKIQKPFIGSSHPTSTFTPDYITHQPLDQFKQSKLDYVYRQKSLNNWKYNNPNKKGYNGTFSKFPQYIQQGQYPKKLPQKVKPWIHNFNGTSKDFNQALTKPSPVPSQLLLNQAKKNT